MTKKRRLSARLEELAFLSLATGGAAFLFSLLDFPGSKFPAWFTIYCQVLMYYAFFAAPFGVVLIVVSQVMKLFKL